MAGTQQIQQLKNWHQGAAESEIVLFLTDLNL